MTVNPNIPATPDPTSDLTSLTFCIKALKQGMDVFAGRFSQQLPYSRAATMADIQTTTAQLTAGYQAAAKAAAQKVSFLVGDGTTTTFKLAHNIGRINNVTQVYGEPGKVQYPEFTLDYTFDPGDPSIPTSPSFSATLVRNYVVTNADYNNISITFPTAPGVGQFRVNVVG